MSFHDDARIWELNVTPMNPTDSPPRSLLVTLIGIFSLLGSVTFFFGDLFGSVTAFYIMRSPDFQMALRELRNYRPSGGLSIISPEGMLISSAAGLIISAAGIAASIGLLIRKNWGRIAFIVVVWLQAVYFAVVGALGMSAVSGITSQLGLDGITGMGPMRRVAGLMTIGGSILLMLLAMLVLWGLSREKIRKEFV